MTPTRFARAMATAAAVAVLAGTLVRSARVQALGRDGDSNPQSAAGMPSAAAPQKPGGKNQKLVPDPVKSSTLRVRLDFEGRMPSTTNATSPAFAGSQLLLIDQWGNLHAWDGIGSHLLLSSVDLPAGISPISSEALQNVAADATGTTVYVTFTSSTVPSGIPQHVSPRPGADAWQWSYQYQFDGAALANPRAITALQVRADNHTSGGLTVLGDGTLLFATGDNGFPGEDGFNYPQEITIHLGKILRINTADGSMQPVALGVRNVQRLVIDPNGGDPHLVFADIGGWVAEEVNAIRLTDLLAGGSTRNFGWGRHLVDGKVREGTFYVDQLALRLASCRVPKRDSSGPSRS